MAFASTYAATKTETTAANPRYSVRVPPTEPHIRKKTAAGSDFRNDESTRHEFPLTQFRPAVPTPATIGRRVPVSPTAKDTILFCLRGGDI